MAFFSHFWITVRMLHSLLSALLKINMCVPQSNREKPAERMGATESVESQTGGQKRRSSKVLSMAWLSPSVFSTLSRSHTFMQWASAANSIFKLKLILFFILSAAARK